MDTKKVELNTFLSATVAVVLIEVLTRFAIIRGFLPPLTGLSIARMLDIILLLWISAYCQNDFQSIGLGRSRLYTGVKKGLIWSAGFGLIATLALTGLYFAGIDPLRIIQMPMPTSPKDIALFMFVGALIGPIAEEIFFRGILFGFLRKWGLWPALIGSTLLFVVSHPAHSGIPVTQLVGGFIFSLSYEIEKSLLTPIIIHVLGNLAIFSISLIT